VNTIHYNKKISAGGLSWKGCREEGGMGELPKEDIIAYRLGNEIVCDNCVKGEELVRLTEKEIIMSSEGLLHVYFCDRCKKQIEGY